MRVYVQFENKPFLFTCPEHIISCRQPYLLNFCFKEIENALDHGYYAAGFVSYEAGCCFEEKLFENRRYDFPLVCMGVYKSPVPFESGRGALLPVQGVKDFRLNISKGRYFQNVEKIRAYIARGEVYQITYCVKMLFRFHGDPFSLFVSLLREQPVPYPAYIHAEDFHILSCSPEMFIKKVSGSLTAKPMKGTWPRGKNIIADFSARMRFQCDVKNRAENVMIADLVRNDLGRIGTYVRTPKIFEISRYKTLYQMTSTVTAHVDRFISLYRIFSSLFPSGSVTGAPKIRAMEVIRSIEESPRKIYTGAIGYISPGREMFFNIPIRTLLIQGEQGEMGIGGGIVWDSTPEGEWNEGMLKARFLTGTAQL